MKKLMLVLLSGLLLSGCVFTTTLPQEQLIQKPIPPTAEAPTISQPVQVTLFYGNEQADGFETTSIFMDQLSAQLIVEKLIEYGVLNEAVTLRSMECKDNTLYLDFTQDFLEQLNTMGTSGERMMIGSVVNTFLTAYPEAESVSITANGEIMESGHVIYDFELTFFE